MLIVSPILSFLLFFYLSHEISSLSVRPYYVGRRIQAVSPSAAAVASTATPPTSMTRLHHQSLPNYTLDMKGDGSSKLVSPSSSSSSSTTTGVAVPHSNSNFNFKQNNPTPSHHHHPTIVDKIKNLQLIHYFFPKERENAYLKYYLFASLAFLYTGKYLNVKIPFILQRTIDKLAQAQGDSSQLAAISTAASLSLVFYGVCRTFSVIFSEIKTCLFAHTSFFSLRRFGNQIFRHLHDMDSSFHNENASGLLAVAYVRAMKGFQGLLFQIVFSVIPAAVELALVANVLYTKCGPIFAGITVATFSLFLAFTVWITQWKIKLRQELVAVENARNGYFVDSLQNHEIVKFFTNEEREGQKFDQYLERIQHLNLQSTYAIALLNFGQALMFSAGLTVSLLVALQRVQQGLMSVGDLVAVNSMLLQLSIPFNFMGFTYQEIRQSLVDMSFMRKILLTNHSPIFDDPSLPDFETFVPGNKAPAAIEFKDVYFRHPHKTENILNGVTFRINAGENVAIVGPSGSGKSTTLRLIARLYDANEGNVFIDNVNVKEVNVKSLRKQIAVVPQDTALFDDSIKHNLLYGNWDATDAMLEEVIDQCNLRHVVSNMPGGLDAMIGERGSRLSGGERQKMSIARALLKQPRIILCDEITSSVDAFAERDIMELLQRQQQQQQQQQESPVSQQQQQQQEGKKSREKNGMTTITIAHRISSIIHCDRILVMEKGRVVMAGTHEELLRNNNRLYADMWQVQNNPNQNKQ